MRRVKERRIWARTIGAVLALALLSFYLAIRRDTGNLPSNVSNFLNSFLIDTILVKFVMIASAPLAFIAYLMIYRCSKSKEDVYKYYGGGGGFKE